MSSGSSQRVSTEEIVAAYRECGSVWKTGKRLGISGQTVWERLRGIGHPMQHPRWSSEEIAELQQLLANGFTITQISHALGRPYGGVAHRISSLGLSNGRGQQQALKLPRGAGWDKDTTKRRIREIERYDGTIHQWCRANGVRLDPLIQAIQRHFLEWWDEYAQQHSALPSVACPNCGRTFYPMTKKQKTCSRRCQAHLRTDRDYFGGRRNEAIGLKEGICQLCLAAGKTLSAHHLFGKEADPENEHLLALCTGCHRIVGILSRPGFLAPREEGTQDGWETLINLVMLRRLGPVPAIRTYVDIEVLGEEQAEYEDEMEFGERQLALGEQL